MTAAGSHPGAGSVPLFQELGREQDQYRHEGHQAEEIRNDLREAFAFVQNAFHHGLGPVEGDQPP